MHRQFSKTAKNIIARLAVAVGAMARKELGA